MNFFSSGLNTLRGQKGQHQTGSETIDKLCDRIEHATLLEDRRASVLALKSCSREHRRVMMHPSFLLSRKVMSFKLERVWEEQERMAGG